MAAAIATAFLDSSVIALSAQYPLRVQEALQLGVGQSTLIGSMRRDLTKLMIEETTLLRKQEPAAPANKIAVLKRA